MSEKVPPQRHLVIMPYGRRQSGGREAAAGAMRHGVATDLEGRTVGRAATDWDFSTHMNAEEAHTVVSSGLQASPIAVSRVRRERRRQGMTEPYEPHSAYLVVLQLRSFADQDVWLDGKLMPPQSFQAGSLAIYDLDRRWMADMRDAYDCLQFHVPQHSIDLLNDELGNKAGTRLLLPPQDSIIDQTVCQLGHALLPALARPEEASTFFLDHLTLAFHAHLVHRYGGADAGPRRSVGKLAPWQLKRAKDYIESNLANEISLDQLSTECRLSKSHLIKAFRLTTGVPPYRWAILRRIERAKDLMNASAMPLAEIAKACGFVDVSHFSRHFKQHVRTTPAVWRQGGSR